MNVSDVLNKITECKRSQANVVDFLTTADLKLAHKLRVCGSWLQVREWTDSGESRLVNANFCKRHLLCRSCAIRRAGRFLDRYGEKADWLLKLYPNLIPVVFTFTIKNGEDLQERVDHLTTSFKAMIAASRKAKSGGARHLPIEWNKVAGCVRAYEVTKSKDGKTWHPHIHAFALLDEYVDQEKLSQEWQRFTGDSFIVGVSECKNGVIPGLIETVKYATKFSSMVPEDLLQAFYILSKMRLVDPNGLFRGVLEGDIDEDDITPDLTGPYRDMIASWMEAQMGYKLTPMMTIEEATQRAFEVVALSMTPQSPVAGSYPDIELPY